MRKLDDWLIDHCFQPSSDKLQDRSLGDCFWFAQIFLTLTAFSWSMIVILADFVDASRVVVGSWRWIIIGGIFLYVGYFMFWINECRNRLKAGTVNYLRIDVDWVVLRQTASLVLLVSAVGLLWEIFFDFDTHSRALHLMVGFVIASGFFYWCTMYFLACTPKPPKPKTESVFGRTPVTGLT